MKALTGDIKNAARCVFSHTFRGLPTRHIQKINIKFNKTFN